MTLDVNQQMLVEQRVANDGKSPVIAYLLWFFLGSLGAHRFYLGRNGTAVLMIVLSVVGWLTVMIGVGLVPLAILGVWLLIDLFLIPGMVTSNRDDLRQRLKATMV